MKSALLQTLSKLAATFVAGIVVFIIGKFIFLLLNADIYSGIGLRDVVSIIFHGLSMDCTMSGYVSVVAALILIVSIFIGSKGVPDRILNAWFVIVGLVLAWVVLLDASLYRYWLFKLDATPIFYFTSSPSSALASAEWWMYIVIPVAWLAIGALFYCIFRFPVLKWLPDVEPATSVRSRIGALSGMIVACALLVVAIRGGVTVSTMNVSRAYFSSDRRLNHAAVNPAFSLLYSLGHQDDFSSQYQYFDEDERRQLFSQLMRRSDSEVPSDTLIAPGSHPDIYVIILESFSSHLFPSLGGENVAMRLDSIAARGLMFDNIYATSFRTDRGLVSILSGYPAQPSTSLMKHVQKTESLPSIASALRDNAGYQTTYYYGGDANFTNMKAFLVNAGFDRIVSDQDFPVSKRLSKWGAHDEEVFSLAASEIKVNDGGRPQLKVIQTSSSHEPFEVPYDDHGRFTDKRATAFAYADSCAASFINRLHSSPEWNNSLVVIVPDHYGAYPDLTDAIGRHRIPLIMTGGALVRNGVMPVIGSQTDIAATLLGQLGVSHDDFIFSRNLADPSENHFAYFADTDRIGFITENDTVVYNLDLDRTEKSSGPGAQGLLQSAKSYLQTIYYDISKR